MRATWKQVLRATSYEGHCLSVYSIRYTAITLGGVDSIALRSTEERLVSLFFCVAVV